MPIHLSQFSPCDTHIFAIVSMFENIFVLLQSSQFQIKSMCEILTLNFNTLKHIKYKKLTVICILGPLLFLHHVSHLSVIINGKSELILCADDTTLVFTTSDSWDIKSDIKIVFECLNECFKGNRLSLNFDATYFIQFRTVLNLIWILAMETNEFPKHMIQNSLEYM